MTVGKDEVCDIRLAKLNKDVTIKAGTAERVPVLIDVSVKSIFKEDSCIGVDECSEQVKELMCSF